MKSEENRNVSGGKGETKHTLAMRYDHNIMLSPPSEPLFLYDQQHTISLTKSRDMDTKKEKSVWGAVEGTTQRVLVVTKQAPCAR